MPRPAASSLSRRSVAGRVASSVLRAMTALALTVALLAPAAALAAGPEGRRATPPAGATQDSGMTSGVRYPGPPAAPLPPPTKEEREAAVVRLVLNPQGSVTMEPEQPLVFTAIPVDFEGQAVQGLVAEWESSAPAVVSVEPGGKAVAVAPGAAVLTARAGGKTGVVGVVVTPATGEKFGGRKKESKREKKKPQQSARVNQSERPSMFVKASYGAPAPAPRPARPARPLFLREPNEDPLPDAETPTLYEPSNQVGRPPHKTEDGAPQSTAAAPGAETPASSNFSLGVPVVSLPGRGLSVSLALQYNSRLWHKSADATDTYLTYDVDSSWPAPGFRMGYGQMEDQGAASSFTLTDPDGTRHRIKKRATGQYDYDSVDGTFIRFHGGRGWGTVTYPHGTSVEYGAAGTGFRSYPVRVTDRNGNYVLINYVDPDGAGPQQPVGPRIASVQDTLGRYVRFNYDANGDLYSVTAPRYDSASGTTEVVRLYYATIDFSGPYGTHNLFNTAQVTPQRPDTVRVIRYVYFPGTRSGYRYVYSPYGMIRQVVQLREMQPANFNLQPWGAASGDGQWAATTSYAYPDSPISLVDQPFLYSRTDDWVGRTSAAPTYVFENEPGLSRVTAPDGSVSESHTITATAAGDEWKNGLVEETVVRESAGGAVLARSKVEWEQGGTDSNPRPRKVWATDEAGKTRAVVYNSYDGYGNALSVSEHDFAAEGAVGAELRRTETDYVTGAAWTGRNLLRLPAEVRVKVGTAVVSRTRFAYDETALTTRGAGAVTNHDQAYNPDAPLRYACHPDQSCEPDDFECGCAWEPQYDPATVYRGNLTTVTRYANAHNSSGATTTTAKYDILGNVVEQSVNCCRKKFFTYTGTYKFAYPESEKKGDDPALQLTTSATYDFNTGVVRKAVDENDQETVFAYDADTLRMTQVLRPDGGRTDFYEEDAIRNGPGGTPRYSHAYTLTYFEAGRDPVSDFQYFDGRGAPVRTFRQAAGQGYATADVQYDQMGRVLKASNPYYSTGEAAAINPAGQWTQNTLFDKLGRVREVTLPDSTKVTSSYDGTVTTVTDQAGRQRRQVVDALGRVREVHEPDDAGNLGTAASPLQKTSYEYDALDNLKKVTQAGSYRGGATATQVREFKYDSLSRLTHQKQVEAAARLDDNGAVSASGTWSRVTKYDEWGQVEYAYDARGVVTHFVYDTLNRVKTVTYSGEATPVTPAVTYNYGEARTDPQGNPYRNKGRLTSALTAALGGAPSTAQEYDYDRAGQVVSQRQKVGSDTYGLSYKYNLAGQLTEQTYPSGRVVKHAFDATARPLATTNAAGTYSYTSNLTYAAHGGLTSQTNGNGTAESVAYNARLQPSALTLSRAGEVLQKYAYKYGQVDQATGTVDEAKNTGQVGKVEGYIGGTTSAPTRQWEQRMSYDTLGRLAKASERRADNSQLSWQSVYSHDRFGNRYQHASEQTSPLSYVPTEAADVDRSTNRSASPTGVEYDYSGNVTKDPRFRSLQYRYDANGRQVWAAWLDNTNQATAAYDALGQRVRTVFNGQTRLMVYDVSGQVVAEYGAADGGGGGLRYVFTDHQGSTRTVTDSQGQVKARRDYEPYGQEVPASVGQRAAQGYWGADGTRQQYAQTERDEATGLDHTPWRKYEQRAGRWTSPDPYLGSMSTGDPQSFNRYTYVQNDPVNFIDPSGLNIEIPGVWDSVDVNASDGYLSSQMMGILRMLLFNPAAGASGGETGGGETGGGEPQQTEPRKDCYDFADEVDRIANDLLVNNNNSANNFFPLSVNAFMDALARRFTEVGSATAWGIKAARDHAQKHGFNPSREFGTEGFQTTFIDREPGSDNQARHAVFGLILGYSGIPSPLTRANGREDANTASGIADTALNNVTVPMGQRITGGVPGHSGELSARGLANWIRQNLCASR